MAKKIKRTQIQDLPQTAQELTLDEANRVRGGAGIENAIKQGKTALATTQSSPTTSNLKDKLMIK